MAFGISRTKILSSDPNELYDRLRLLLQEKHAGNISNLIDEEIVAIIDKLLEYKCISKKQHKQILIKFNLLYLHIIIYLIFNIYKCPNSMKNMK